jgi:hypothetical protein
VWRKQSPAFVEFARAWRRIFESEKTLIREFYFFFSEPSALQIQIIKQDFSDQNLGQVSPQ